MISGTLRVLIGESGEQGHQYNRWINEGTRPVNVAFPNGANADIPPGHYFLTHNRHPEGENTATLRVMSDDETIEPNVAVYETVDSDA